MPNPGGGVQVGELGIAVWETRSSPALLPVRGPSLRELVTAHLLAMLADTFLAAMAVQGREKGVEADKPDLVDLTPAEIRCLPRQLNPAAILHASTTRWTGPSGGVATRHVPDAVIACGAGTRWWDKPGQDHPTHAKPLACADESFSVFQGYIAHAVSDGDEGSRSI